ncbi:hypothetical protein ABZ929_01760 [Streptomyces physcomitrii]|uniref:nSTAND1 domain-containing NTPase n=1 Tax=Streptomyces physcomitrii TaxID=2724184 RepID=UPI00340D9DF4
MLPTLRADFLEPVPTHRAYEQLGGVTGALGDHAEEVRAAHVPPEDAEVARRLLSRLVRVPTGGPAATALGGVGGRAVGVRRLAELAFGGAQLADRVAGGRLRRRDSGCGAENRLLCCAGFPVPSGGTGPETRCLAGGGARRCQPRSCWARSISSRAVPSTAS